MLTKILVIEDMPNIQKLVKTNLVASGYNVLVAGSGEEGLKIAQLENPELIVLDLELPDMLGWDVYVALKAKRDLQHIPVILMTATVLQEEEYEITGMKAAGYLIKPFEVNKLLHKIKQVLGELA
jgi:DNA-binding response OmpR family regulator